MTYPQWGVNMTFVIFFTSLHILDTMQNTKYTHFLDRSNLSQVMVSNDVHSVSMPIQGSWDSVMHSVNVFEPSLI